MFYGLSAGKTFTKNINKRSNNEKQKSIIFSQARNQLSFFLLFSFSLNYSRALFMITTQSSDAYISTVRQTWGCKVNLMGRAILAHEQIQMIIYYGFSSRIS